MSTPIEGGTIVASGTGRAAVEPDVAELPRAKAER